MKIYSPSLVFILCVGLSACATLAPRKSTGDRFGHRIRGSTDDGRTTITITTPGEGIEYRFFDATYESVAIRPETVTEANAADGVSVEVLVKGAFPDSCSQLHDVVQQRAGNLVLVTLTMRRPQGAVCASVLRPYRFYLGLEGAFTSGPYSLKLNENSHPFEVKSL